MVLRLHTLLGIYWEIYIYIYIYIYTHIIGDILGDIYIYIYIVYIHYWGYIGIMEKKMEATILYRGNEHQTASSGAMAGMPMWGIPAPT